MRKSAQIVFLCLVIWCLNVKTAAAIKITPTVIKEASPTAMVVPTAEIRRVSNITEPGSKESGYRLEEVLKKNKTGKWNGINSVRKIVEIATDRGVAANTVVLLLMLPLIATLVSGLHYIFGLSGYGIFMPTMIGVALLATGILGGLVLFAIILTISLLSNLVLRKYKLHFWPARSIGLMMISICTFGLMLGSTYIKVLDISKISIFPVLFMIMLSEEFVRTQLAKSKNEAKKLMLGTLILSMVGAITMSIRQVQEAVLLNPEISLVLGLVLNITVGNYTGIRLSEISRFKKAIRKK